MTAKRNQPTPPDDLRPETAKWWSSVVGDYELEPHHVRLLTLAGEAWDRTQQARVALAEHGLTFVDRFDQPRVRPEVSIERDSRLAFARLLRELALDVEEPSAAPRPVQIKGHSALRIAKE